MASVHWQSAVSGDFSNASDWSIGAEPGPSDDAILDASGPNPYTVSVSKNTTVNSIQTASNALLDILAGFSATSGTGTGANAGAIQIENGGTLTLQGTVDNTGFIEIVGTTLTTSIVLGPGAVTLTGGGPIFLDFTGGGLQQIVAAAGGCTLTDVADRISGQGLIGGPGLTIINEAGGFIEAKGGLLTIDTGPRTIVNAGLIDAEGAPAYPYVPGQGLILSPVSNSGIIETDGTGSTMTFAGAVTGAGRAIVAGGILSFASTFDQNVTFLGPSGALVLADSQAYASTIILFSKTGAESLDLRDIGYVGPNEAAYRGTLSAGVLTVSDGVHTAAIHFQGDYTGTVFIASSDGHGGTTITDEPMAIHWQNAVSGQFAMANDWLGGMAPGQANDAELDAAGGAYTVAAPGATTVKGIQLASNATLSITGDFAAINGTDGGQEAGRVIVANGGTLVAGGAWDITGSTQLLATTARTSLIVNGALSLAGGGKIQLGDSANNLIIGSTASATFTNTDCTIAGAGSLGGGGMILVNQARGHILAGTGNHSLLINTGANTIINAGVISASGAGLIINSPIENDNLLQTIRTTLTITKPVTGSGHIFISGGTADFEASFNQLVYFSSGGGTLALARSASYNGSIHGYSATAGDVLDLRDIAFVSVGEATFSGTTKAGTLTVSDGTHTAHIKLSGAINGATFMAAPDGHGGTMVTASAAPAALAGFIAAMAGQSHRASSMTATLGTAGALTPLISVPHTG